MDFIRSQLTVTRAPLWAGAFSAGMLIAAWTFQYGFGYPPCQMCYWQRHAHKIVFVTALLAFVMHRFGKGDPRIWTGLVTVALLGSFAMGLWHMGVEYSWWEGPKTCAAGGNLTKIDPSKLLENLSKPQKMPACKDAVWHFMGLSMAGWNALLSLGAAGLVGFAAIKGHKS